MSEKKKFLLIQDDFENCNDYFLKLCSNDDNVTFSINYKNNDISSIDMFVNDDLRSVDIRLESKLIESLDNIYEKAFVGGFDSIYVTPTRISYGGMSNRLYVFSKNGKRPNYFYSPNQIHEFSYSIYHLTKNWFLLKSH